jgi:hypothetical protein
MTEMTDLERQLLDDLEEIGDRARDEKFCTELYRALADNVWKSGRRPGERLSVSWQRAEWLINEWRRRHGGERLDLDRSGREGEVSRTVAEELASRGWSYEPLDTSRHDPAHVGLDEAPPPPDHGERMARVPPSGEDEPAAHEAASAERERKGT